MILQKALLLVCFSVHNKNLKHLFSHSFSSCGLFFVCLFLMRHTVFIINFYLRALSRARNIKVWRKWSKINAEEGKWPLSRLIIINLFLKKYIFLICWVKILPCLNILTLRWRLWKLSPQFSLTNYAQISRVYEQWAY